MSKTTFFVQFNQLLKDLAQKQPQSASAQAELTELVENQFSKYTDDENLDNSTIEAELDAIINSGETNYYPALIEFEKTILK